MKIKDNEECYKNRIKMENREKQGDQQEKKNTN